MFEILSDDKAVFGETGGLNKIVSTWPDCSHCGSDQVRFRMGTKDHTTWYCTACKREFSVSNHTGTSALQSAQRKKASDLEPQETPLIRDAQKRSEAKSARDLGRREPLPKEDPGADKSKNPLLKDALKRQEAEGVESQENPLIRNARRRSSSAAEN